MPQQFVKQRGAIRPKPSRVTSGCTPGFTPVFTRGFTRGLTPGFTLVELMIVIGIIGILIGLVVTIVPRVKRSVYAAQTSAQLSALSGAIQQYYNDFKAYPGPLPNNQLGIAYDTSNSSPQLPFIYYNGNTCPLTATTPPTNTMGITFNGTQGKHITGAQNLVLGLLGGLQFQTTGTPVFYYNPNAIFPDGQTPGPTGAASLNPNAPRRQQSYIQVRPGDISVPSMTYNGGQGASFQDAAGRSPTDAPIPVFLDKYPDPLPILYIRTNVGGKAIVGIRNKDDNGSSLVDNSNSFSGYQGILPIEQPQFDLCQILDYTTSKIGVTNNSVHDHHGLQGVGTFLTDTIDSNSPTGAKNGYLPSGENGKNGAAYFRDPSYKVDPSNRNNNYDPSADNTHNGIAREKDGFLLITGGPDRVYGTSDDIIFPGSLQVSQ